MLSGTAAIALAAALATFSPTAWADTTGTSGTEAAMAIDASELMGDSVENAEGEVLGEVDTLVVQQDGSISQVIVGVGGFLGIGEKDVAIAWDRITVHESEDRLVADVSRDELTDMPDYEWPADYREGSLIDDTAGDRGMTATQQAAQNQDADAVDDAGDNLPPNQDFLAGALIGSMILDRSDEDIGEIEDVVLAADGSAMGVVADIGGFLGVDEKQVMIEWKDLEVRRDDDGKLLVRTGLDKAALDGMQTFDYDAAAVDSMGTGTTNSN